MPLCSDATPAGQPSSREPTSIPTLGKAGCGSQVGAVPVEIRGTSASPPRDGAGSPQRRCGTWTRDSGRLIFRATSSRMKMSG